jgi:hypothetical protein
VNIAQYLLALDPDVIRPLDSTTTVVNYCSTARELLEDSLCRSGAYRMASFDRCQGYGEVEPLHVFMKDAVGGMRVVQDRKGKRSPLRTAAELSAFGA